jgi:hypothetical protein
MLFGGAVTGGADVPYGLKTVVGTGVEFWIGALTADGGCWNCDVAAGLLGLLELLGGCIDGVVVIA